MDLLLVDLSALSRGFNARTDPTDLCKRGSSTHDSDTYFQISPTIYLSLSLSLSLFLSFQSMYYPDPAFDQYTVQQQQQHHHMFHQPHHIMQPHYIQELQLEPLQPIPQPRQVQVSHPYARLFAKKDQVKRRKIWNHALEKSLFNPFEL